jgi:hypothetical protein
MLQRAQRASVRQEMALTGNLCLAGKVLQANSRHHVRSPPCCHPASVRGSRGRDAALTTVALHPARTAVTRSQMAIPLV